MSLDPQPQSPKPRRSSNTAHTRCSGYWTFGGRNIYLSYKGRKWIGVDCLHNSLSFSVNNLKTALEMISVVLGGDATHVTSDLKTSDVLKDYQNG